MSQHSRCLTPAILVDQALLPGEFDYWHPVWEDDAAVTSALTEGDHLVVLPRELLHHASWPAVGVLASLDRLQRDEHGKVAAAQLFGLRRVSLLRVAGRRPHLTVEMCELPPGATASGWAERKLASLIGRATCAEF